MTVTSKEAVDFYVSVFPDSKINSTDSTFKFNEAVSFAVTCEDQAEIDYYWEKLSAVPEAEQCGWLKDNYGLSWQVVPKNVHELLQRPGAFANMMKMKKLVIADY